MRSGRIGQLAVPVRGEVWWVDFEPHTGHEQGLNRPAIVISSTTYNQGPAQLAAVIPLTTTNRRLPIHIKVEPRDGAVRSDCYAMCDQLRFLSTERFDNRLGILRSTKLDEIAAVVRTLLDL